MKPNTYKRVVQAWATRPGRVVATVILALTGSLIAVFFLRAIDFVYEHIFPVLARQSIWVFIVGSFVALTASSALVGWLLGTFMPSAAGSGIPQLKAAYRTAHGRLSWRAVWVKMLGGIVSLGGGASMGREGPTVYASGAAAAALADTLGASRRERSEAISIGAAAGLSAAFNTPLAAITFVVEELSNSLNSRQLGGVILAAVMGAFCTWAVIGQHPAFQVPFLADISWRSYALASLAAGLASLAGIVFQRQTLRLRVRFRCRPRLKAWFQPVVGGWCVWLLGCGAFLLTGRLGVFSLGYRDVADALNGSLPWQSGLVLLVAKLAATTLIYAWGGCGGIFSPTLFFGAMAGIVVAGTAGLLGVPMDANTELVLALVGMSACFNAVVRAPMTALLIVFEMTGRYDVVPALMIGTFISMASVRLFGGNRNFYDAILEQDGIAIRPGSSSPL